MMSAAKMNMGTATSTLCSTPPIICWTRIAGSKFENPASSRNNAPTSSGTSIGKPINSSTIIKSAAMSASCGTGSPASPTHSSQSAIGLTAFRVKILIALMPGQVVIAADQVPQPGKTELDGPERQAQRNDQVHQIHRQAGGGHDSTAAAAVCDQIGCKLPQPPRG